MITVSGIAILQLDDDEFVHINADELDESVSENTTRGMGPERSHTFTYTDDLGREAEWTVDEYPLGSLNNVSFYSADYRQNEGFDFDISDEYQDDLVIQRENAILNMTEWFHGNFQDPANRLPYISKEGGYQYIYGGPYDAAEQLGENFSDAYPEDWVEAAVEAVQTDGVYDWDKMDDPSDYGEDELNDELDDLDELIANVPSQTPGPLWGIREDKIVPVSGAVRYTKTMRALHAQLRDAVADAVLESSKLGNKFPDLLHALHEYRDVVERPIENVEEVSAFTAGLKLEGRFRVAKSFGDRDDDEYPSLGMNEQDRIRYVLTLHAPFIQSTEIGAQLTELAERDQRTPKETRQQNEAVTKAVEILLPFSDIIDSPSLKTIRANAQTEPDDPQHTKRTGLARLDLTNLSIVLGVLSVAPLTGMAVGGLVGATVIGGQLATASGAALGVIGSGLAGKTILIPALRDTKAFSETRKAVTEELDKLFDEKSSLIKRASAAFRKALPFLRPAVGAPGIDAWFDALQEKDRQRNARIMLSGMTGDVFTTPEIVKPDGRIGYQNGGWIVDEDGMSARDGSHDLNVSEIYSTHLWQSQETETQVYHMPLHFSLKSRMNLDLFMDAWIKALIAHETDIAGRLIPEVLRNTTSELDDRIEPETRKALEHLIEYVEASESVF